MSGRLQGRRALITGASRGIGAATARAFAREGADVAFCHDDDDEGAAAVLADIAAAGRRGFAWRIDVGSEAGCRDLFAKAESALGGIDVMMNNAGVSEEALVEDTTMDALRWMLRVHLEATFLLSQLAYRAMKPRGFGRIINVTSQLAYKGAPGLAHYSAAKAGIVGFTRAFAQEAAPHGVLVNAIAPGPIDTRLNDTLSPEWKAWKIGGLPLRRFGRPEEIAPTAVMLASADGDFYVGQTLSPNGGDVFL
ncbi:SDR family NAD(P)-dependent oxidoreductase [Mongoliimonas terrestris]|uniref:SDR family NAD(P)-dependent oxidoreductase n=1 Tax=Mongoliimonas terrestris TaxID=1709001 RepID=UPI000949856C|nr:SDR family oxidoreductase [Mongoliimonas terrestris]